MTVACLLLAAAVLVAPSASGIRARAGRIDDARDFPTRRLVVAAALTCSVATAFIVPLPVALAAAVVGATFVAAHRRRLVRARRIDESAVIRSALAILVGELRVGAHPVAAVEAAAAEATGAPATWLRAVAARARLGADVADGLRAVAVQSALPAHWERLAVCWDLAHTHGISVATLANAVHRDVVERDRFSSRVSAGMAGARATAGVLACLPVLGVGLGQLIGADPLRFLLSGGAGGWLLVIGSTLACCGVLWSDRITSRVLS